MPAFRTEIVLVGNNTGIVVPPEVVDALGAGKKPKVVVTLNGFTYRSSIASMGGQFVISLSAERRAAAGVKGGETMEVAIDLDTAPREVKVPDDLAAVLDAEPAAKAFFQSLSYSNQSRHVLSINDARTDETRRRRIEKAMETLRAGKK